MAKHRFWLVNRRTAVLWVVSGGIIGTILASLNDAIKQNPWVIAYGGLVGGWLLFLTTIAAIHITERKRL